ncbi:MAG: hypothetical protein KKB03_03400 [Nanoarchaeota archaeon]|nr:hypothetical protein [Nanoarchaeota archaeon]MBU1134916.1 hypothetical protein [Nanoarchaeota archaeon]MBU2520259.1 hypothetical protein [Nanoarchaeota archaeon]
MPEENDFRKPFSTKIIVSAIIITAILFGGGLFTGYVISEGALNIFDTNINDISKDVDNFQLQFLFLDVLGENATCPLLEGTMNEINAESYDIGTRLDIYGADKIDINLKEYIDLKKDYSRLLITYWLLSKKMQDVCGSNANTIVYFYEDSCTDCDTQGFILTHLKTKHNENLLVFALDGTLDEPSVKALKEFYNIKQYPSIIVNGQLYERIYTADELEAIFK